MNYYGPAVFAVAALAAISWFLYTGEVSTAVLIGVTTIIMGYPCALGITTPMVLAIGGGHGIARGLLVRAGEFFQALAETDAVVFDKTGTLTYGRPTVRDVVPFDTDEHDLLATVAAAEVGSEHPLAGAIVRFAHFQEIRVPESTEFRVVPGKGVIATVGGRRVVVGRPSFLSSEGIALDGIPARVRELEPSHTVVYAAADQHLIGAVALQDTPRPGAARLMRRLHILGLRTVMLTGDSRGVAEAVAREIGIDEVHAELLPPEKVDIIERLQREGHTVAMVGDGINDAPALVQSDVGIALGAGTDVAMQSAGVVLVSDKLDKVASAVVLGRASHRKMQQNIAIAVISNIVGISLALLGIITAPLAIAIMAISVLAVLASTLLLLRLRLDDAVESAVEESLAEAVITARRMHCDACSRRIRLELGKVDGVRVVEPDAVRKEVFIAYEPARVNEDRLRDELEALGFR
jgi:heavy metal translocating P-type ATPase